MHLRYDLKNKLDLSNFETQSNFFLAKKQQCDFSFYLKDMAIVFEVEYDSIIANEYRIIVNMSELDKEKNETSPYRKIYPLTDPRFSDLSFIKDLFVNSSSEGLCAKSSKEDVIGFIMFMIKLMYKINKLSMVA